MFIQKREPDKTDAELLELYKKSEEQRYLTELFGRYAPLMLGVCLKYLKNREDARDAVMQIFEKLSTSLSKHDIENFKSWLYVTTRNHCLMHLRANKGRFMEEFQSEVMENELVLHPNEEVPLEENIEKLKKCIDLLNGEQQTCVRMFFIKEKCYKEIVDATGFDLKKVKSYIQNGKRNLRICMEKNA